MSNQVISILKEAEFFSGLPGPALERVAAVQRPRRIAKREVLFLEETRGDEMYLLVEGSIRLHKSSADGDEIVIRTIRPGEVFAEVVVFERDRYPVTATAVVDSELLVFRKQDVVSLLEDADFRNAFIAMLMRKQRYLAERVRYLTSSDVEERFFLFLKEQYGPVERMKPGISKKDLALAIGATPETLSRLILRLTQEGALLRWKAGQIELRKGFWEDF